VVNIDSFNSEDIKKSATRVPITISCRAQGVTNFCAARVAQWYKPYTLSLPGFVLGRPEFNCSTGTSHQKIAIIIIIFTTIIIIDCIHFFNIWTIFNPISTFSVCFETIVTIISVLLLLKN